MPPLEPGPDLGPENALDFLGVGQGHEQGLRKAQADPSRSIDEFDRDNLRFVGADLRIPDDAIPGELHPRQAKPFDQRGYRHSRFPF